MSKINIKKYFGINVVRDDLLEGGTKSILLPNLIDLDENEYVYASPVYGGFQIALSIYCKINNIKCTIFCAKRKIKHINTIECINNGANVVEIRNGYLSVVEKRAREYCRENGAKKIKFGANTVENKILIANRMKKVIALLGKEPDEIWCAVGSGTLLEGILLGTENAEINGVIVGKEYKNNNPRIKRLIKYPKDFDKESKFSAPFPSMPNYDLKAFEYCYKYSGLVKDTLFWNVL